MLGKFCLDSPFPSKDDFADGLVDEKISISDYSLSASVSYYSSLCRFENLTSLPCCLWQGTAREPIAVVSFDAYIPVLLRSGRALGCDLKMPA